MRLDVFLKENGYFESREKAQVAIRVGAVKVNGSVVKKTSFKVSPTDEIDISDYKQRKYVSRAALKLLEAKEKFGLNFKDKVVLDLGASTGGFTQIALEFGAKKVYAVDVGVGQLHASLTQNSKVVNLEKTDVRDLSTRIIKEEIDILVSDLSFVSVFKVLPFAISFLKDGAELAVLFKPQFEVGKENIGKNGIVKNEEAIKRALQNTESEFTKMGLTVKCLIKSPIKGKIGNTEYLFHLKKGQ